ncbi:hypothetical protein OAH85_07025 [Paracoccaceae bacterium]|nr:hypothetical protein [Paracoccaceae bacterium]
MLWEKAGIIFRPDTELWWSKSHAMIPTPYQLNESLYRVYYSGRNDMNQSHIGWFELEMDNPQKILAVSKEPVLEPGRLGCFDDNGVTPSCAIKLNNGKMALYYIGWNPGSTVRMHLFGGLALSDNNGLSFYRHSEAPILERNPTDPFLNTAPWVVKTEGGYRMYYVSGSEWLHKDLPRYNIKTAFSVDGTNWDRKGEVAVDFKDQSENALARPFVLKEDHIWKMWFSYKSNNYRIGYAESIDGISWNRIDGNMGLRETPKGFDSQMVEYSSIVRYQEHYFMFYNGNNYGQDGIGLAKMKIV